MSKVASFIKASNFTLISKIIWASSVPWENKTFVGEVARPNNAMLISSSNKELQAGVLVALRTRPGIAMP